MKKFLSLVWLMVAFVGIGLLHGQSPGDNVSKFKQEVKSELAVAPAVVVDQRLFGIHQNAREANWQRTTIDYETVAMQCQLQKLPLSSHSTPTIPASALLPAQYGSRSSLGSIGNPIHVYNSPFGSAFRVGTYSPPDIARREQLPYVILH